MDDYKGFSYYETKGLTGLKNLGNTCYMNASLQCLSHTMNLTHYFMSKKFQEDISVVNQKRLEYHLVLRYMDVVSNIWQENQIISPKTFKMTMEAFVKRFVGYQQQDAHECIVFILDLLHKGLSVPVEMSITGVVKSEDDIIRKRAVEVWKNNFSKEYSYIVENFYGQMHIKMRCPKCNYTSHNFDPFSCIPLTIANKEKVMLRECIIKTGKAEVLDDENKWFCEGCKEKVNGIRETGIWKLPNILVIQLKKFTKSGKINKKVEFNIKEVNLSKFVETGGQYKYELYATTNHSGSLNAGHYWAYCKRGREWFNFNDTTVTKMEEDKVIAEENYVLFFRKI